MARLREFYKDTVVPELVKQFGYKSVMEVPRIEKITLNMGVGEAVADKKVMEHAVSDLEKIAGQKPVVTVARKSIAGFKIRDNYPVGCKVTLRRDQMFEFLDRLITIALPRVRDAAPGEDLVRITLVPDVPHQAVGGRVVHEVQRDGELHHAQAGAEMPAALAHRFDQVGAQLLRDGGQLGFAEAPQVGRRCDLGEAGISLRINHVRIISWPATRRRNPRSRLRKGWC